MNGEPSRTATITAAARGDHRLSDPPPWILDDPFALMLVGPTWPTVLESRRAAFGAQFAHTQTRAGLALRSRYAEDRLAAGEYRQYVILGAGLDSFAWRRPDLARAIRVIEVDHPATQAWKRSRAAALALPAQPGQIFAPIDFEFQTLRSGLSAAGFDWSEPTLFSLLGVAVYLTTTAIEATLRTVASCSHSEIVISYFPPPEFMDNDGRHILKAITQMVADRGEPIQTLLPPSQMESLLTRCGLQIAEHPTADTLHHRYFASRSDGLRAYTTERLIAARTQQTRD